MRPRHPSNQRNSLTSFPTTRRSIEADLILCTAGVAAAVGAGNVVAGLSQTQAVAAVSTLAAVTAIWLAVLCQGLASLPTVFMTLASFTMAWTSLRVASSVTVSDIFLVAAALTLALGFERRWTRIPDVFKPLLIGASLIVAGGTLASIFSPEVSASVARVPRLGLASVGVVLLVALWNPTVAQIKVTAWAWLLSASISPLYGMLEGAENYFGRQFGLATHQNNMALCCVLALGPAIAFTLEGPLWQRLAGVSISLVLIVGVLTSGSRAGLIGMIVVVVSMLAVLNPRMLSPWVLVAAVSTYLMLRFDVVTLGTNNALSRLLALNDGAQVFVSNEARLMRLESAWNVILTRPGLGVGLQSGRAAHSLYVQLLAATGILGLSGFIIVARHVLKLSLAARRVRYDSTKARLLLLGFSTSYVGFLVAELVSNAFWERFMWLPPALMVALVFRMQGTEAPYHES